MLSDCRLCAQPVDEYAEVCPHCGVETPTASATVIKLDAFRGCANVFFWVLLVSAVLCTIAAVISYFADDGDDGPITYCSLYEIWTTEDAKVDALRDKYGPEEPMPELEFVELQIAFSRRDAAWERMWELAPESATIASIRSDCTGSPLV